MNKISFKQYLKEGEDALTRINTILDVMSEDEIDEFGWVLYDTFFDDEKDTAEDEVDFFYIDDIKEMIDILGPEFYESILDFLDDEEDAEDHSDYEENFDNMTEDEDDLDEAIDKSSPIYQTYVELKKKPLKELRDIVKTKQKIIDLSGVDKHSAISRILRSQYGDKKVAAVFGLSEAELEDEDLEESIVVTWVDRDYKKQKKIFKSKSSDAAGAAETKANNFAKKLKDNPDIRSVKVETINEGVSKRMMAKRFNRKKRKFMKTSAAELRRTQTIRKRENRAGRAGRLRYYRANKVKLAAYQKSRSDAIKKGKHKIKLRRKTGSGGGA